MRLLDVFGAFLLAAIVRGLGALQTALFATARRCPRQKTRRSGVATAPRRAASRARRGLLGWIHGDGGGVRAHVVRDGVQRTYVIFV